MILEEGTKRDRFKYRIRYIKFVYVCSYIPVIDRISLVRLDYVHARVYVRPSVRMYMPARERLCVCIIYIRTYKYSRRDSLTRNGSSQKRKWHFCNEGETFASVKKIIKKPPSKKKEKRKKNRKKSIDARRKPILAKRLVAKLVSLGRRNNCVYIIFNYH